MISIIITAYESPNYTKECIKRILSQKIGELFELIIACPDELTKNVIFEYKKKYPKIIKYVKQDYACPKNQLINEIIKIAKGRILIWTDGNKFLEKEAIPLILSPFKDPRVGIAGGRIISLNKKDNLLGFWANMLAKSLNEMRKNRFKKKKFIEHSVNLLAMRSGIIKEIPLDVAEGAILSFIISNKGYKNVYVEKAKVLVIYPKTFKLFLSQRMRSAKAHMELIKYTKNSRIKYSNFYNEVLYYATRDIFNNFFWSLSFVIILLYTQIKVFYDLRIRKKHYNAVWKCTNTN